MEANNKENRPPNPRAKANCIEILTFSWILKLFKTGYKRDLEENDVYNTLTDHESSPLGSDLEKRWRIELVNANRSNREPSLLRVICKMFGFMLVKSGLIQMFVEVVLRVFQPILIGGLLTYFTSSGSNTTNIRDAYLYATGLLVNMLLNILLFHNSQIEMMQIGMMLRIACCSVIFKKALRLSKTSLGETTIGQVVNLLSNDVNRFDMICRFLHFIWIGPLGTIVITYLLWKEIGISSLIGVTVLIAIIPLQGWLGKKTSEFRLKIAPMTDGRIKLMNEIIMGIQVIKMYTWEKPFTYLVQNARKMEVKHLRSASHIRVVLNCFKIFHTRLALFISILAYILLGNTIDTQKVFIVISYYNILLTTMTVFFPAAIGMYAETIISVKRIQKSEDKLTNGMKLSTVKDEHFATNNTDNQNTIEQSNETGIVISNASAKWINDHTDNSLNNINLTVKSGRLVAIIGPVGAGKSSLIHAILQEIPLSQGNISVRGVVSYASQEPWLFNASIQQNILFGSPMDTERYKTIVEICALNRDFMQLPYGDRTLVGDRGVSLSGGQKSRINLARAVYKQADIYLLDDPLSAVDTLVGQHLFDKCIKGYLKEKTCILITHQIQYLTSIDQIVLMENTHILAQGSYQELQSSSLDFTKMLESLKEITVASDKGSSNKNESVIYLDVFHSSSQQSFKGSMESISRSINGSTIHGEIETNPVEVSETCSTGNISRDVYFSYISAGGSAVKISCLIFICLLAQMLGTGGDCWISYWVELEDHGFRDLQNVSTIIYNSTSVNNDSFTSLVWFSFDFSNILLRPLSRQNCIIIFTVLNVALLAIVIIRWILFVSFFTETSMNLHNNMFGAISRATMYFFNTNNSGRILNRFTKDMGSIDESLSVPLLDFVYIFLSLIGTLVVIGLINIYLMIPTFIIGVLYYYTTVFYLSTSRSIKRLEGVSRSPVFAHMNASLQGLTTIRAFEAEGILSKEFDEHQDLHSSVWFLFIASSEAFGFVLDIICFIYLSFVTYSFIIIRNELGGGYVGLILTQLINLTGAVQWGIRQAAELENQMTSVERVLEYTNIPQEAALESPPEKKPPKEWPSEGKIVFQQFYLQYSPDAPEVLKNLNIRIQSTEKIGIVGRTGAGKSSLISALFRLALNKGNIIIDDIEIHELGLHDLRSKLSIIPQEPVLFSGTMRKNLDPFNEYDDHDLWNALNDVQLKEIVEDLPNGLNSKMSEGGSNFSVGQRQLVCLARAVLKSNKILILDEATANVDSQTDALIQNTIKKKFKNCTVLTIAHRLNTVMDSDKVLVMDGGKMVEYDHPYKLLKNKNGYLYKMVTMDAGSKLKQFDNPRIRANILEMLTFSWLFDIFKTGYKRDLEETDLYLTMNTHKASYLGSVLEKKWKAELIYAKNANRKPSLLRVLIRIFGPTLMFYGSLQVFTEIGLRISRPLFIGGLLAYFNPVGLEVPQKKYAYYYAVGLVLNMSITTLLHHYLQMELEHCGMKIRVACCSQVYKKALKLSRSSLGKTTVGQVVNLISNDVGRFDVALKCVNFLWIGPLGTIVITYFMWREIGISSIIGVAGLLMVTPVQAWMGTETSKCRLKIAPRTDERVKLMNEIISGIQVIKMYTWEQPFAYLIKIARKKELQEIKKASYIRIGLQSFRLIHTKMSFFISILVYMMLGNNVTAKKVFVVLMYYNIMSIMTVIFPQGIVMLADMLISVKRIQNFLLNDEKMKQITSQKAQDKSTNGVKLSKINGENAAINNKIIENHTQKSNDYGIVATNASAKWIENQSENSLNNINLTVRPGRLVAIIGPVGAGKSSLFQAILQELPLSKGNISIRGVVSYASQESWLFNASVQQNILFGSPMNKERYKEVIDVCALKTDFVQLPFGDKSIVGERGVSLSGGQKARINLARAVYKQADIYLLDDPLSAVDTLVGQHLFDKCIKGYLKDKSCILITHQVQYLTSVDHIVLMENAHILAEGSYQELRASNLGFTKLLEFSKESDGETNNKNESHLYLEVPLVSPLKDSMLSISSSIDENGKCDKANEEPVEIAESRSFGNVSREVYFSYITAGGNAFRIFCLVCICILTQVLCTGGACWISYWVNLEDNFFHKEANITSSTMNNNTNSYKSPKTFLWWSITRQYCIIVYGLINIMTVVIVVIRCVLFVSFFMGSSMNLHNSMFNSITKATMYFFNTNSSGRILNRFTKDMGVIDEMIQMPLMDFVNTLLSLIGTLIVVGGINHYLMIPTFFIGIFYYYTIVIYLSTSRSTKRLEGVSRSSVYGHMNASLQGLTTIRAFEAEDILSKEFDNYQDLNSSAWYLFISSSHAFGFALDTICLIYISLLCFIFLSVDKESNGGGHFGLIITQAMGLMNRLQWGIRQSAELENQMTSVERVLEYKNVAQEVGYESSLDKKPPKEWPSKGQIVFHQYCLQYSPETPYVLKNINVKIDPLEKVGIVGRTGAGKSSLISALFRLSLHDGNIIIDDLEIHELGLQDLRSKLSIIPQEPVLFSGTMRKNLDPFDQFSDHDLWNTLDEVQLKEVVEDLPNGLNSNMFEGGSNFSVGQRQLVCLARAILRSNKILILDEATANVDSQTDALIQNTIKKKFQNCTVLTIAHRLNTVMDSDKVLVMDTGTMVEFDHPYNLLRNKNGYLYKMVEQTGRATADWLHSIAEEILSARGTYRFN
ncbi:ABC transporter type 1, transmembrane domain,ABC transporter-like,P-loop containing nucleoside triphosphate [Cinara cedri]|uniref:ABC transporter type 1, transmembrane domain,ABC transporter-like,P-loop containing nucleoside triphosphate n=1 Tax=Cinara cedri TaxID=506608 RepID=A0A5E4MJH6_9HEMI|nr:ABC transporter type 1, transmembrane domain,ABC transporter-like,P-loop containing nucleoside triphosphate [Cinara cedri]